MDIKVLDSWLREYLLTKAKPQKIAEYLSLSGPSVERVHKLETDFLYDIEVTTNRVDSASIYGIAREASAILPRFGIRARLKPLKFGSKNYIFKKSVNYLNAVVEPKLCERFTAILIKDTKVADSPPWIQNRLESAGIRAINNIIDISNYIMLELGQPVHTFDYDKILGKKMSLRESKRGERITTLDGKNFTLNGGDIVIEDGEGRLIDLAGVMGGDLSAIDNNTKNVLLFVQTYNPINIRRTSMNLAQRTMAATIFEKGTDPELVGPAILKGIDLFINLTGGTPEKDILDIYLNPYKPKKIKVDYDFINNRLGISISKKDIADYLNALKFEINWKGNTLEASIPSFRVKDIYIKEDILEEIARLYGYHNLPSEIMEGKIPGRLSNPIFRFEWNIKNILSGWGGSEVYTLSLVSKKWVNENALKLKNPLGFNCEYLRTSLMPSLISAAKENIGTFGKFHIFEMANIYTRRKNDLPEERLILAGIFFGTHYREGKGVAEALLEKLNISASFEVEDSNGFAASKSIIIKKGGNSLGRLGVTNDSNFIYYEFDVNKLSQNVNKLAFQDIPKYPPQIEDLTLIFPTRTNLGAVIATIKSTSLLVKEVQLKDIYKDNFTFRIEYQDEKETLTNQEVKQIRNKILSTLKHKFQGYIK